MTNQCGRFLSSIRNIKYGVFMKAAEGKRNSQVLTIDPKLHPTNDTNTSALIIKEDNDDAVSQSIPSNSRGSSLTSS